MKRLAVIAAVALVLAVGGITAFLSTRGSTEPAGPLACRNCGRNGLSFPVDANEPFTYGLLVLRNPGDETAILERVVPLRTSPGLRLIGEVALRTRDNPWNVTASDHHHFPPENVKAVVRPLRGYRIPPATSKADVHEVMLGFVVPSGGRFAFHALALDYHVGDHHYRAVFRFGLRVCAPARLHEDDCEPPNGPGSA